MITIIGVGHVFDISRPLEKVILERNPSVVCVELDPMRYQSLMEPGGRKDMPLPYRMLARLQERIAKKYGTQVGREMITAIETAKTLNAKLAFIDMDSSKTVSSFFKSMSRKEKAKFAFALLSSFFVSKKRIEKELERFEEGEEDYIEMFGREFPAAKRMIIDDRNRYMASAIKKINQEYENIVAVVGDGHVEGIRTLLEPMDLEIIRLSQLRKAEPEKVDEVTVSYTVSYDDY